MTEHKRVLAGNCYFSLVGFNRKYRFHIKAVDENTTYIHYNIYVYDIGYEKYVIIGQYLPWQKNVDDKFVWVKHGLWAEAKSFIQSYLLCTCNKFHVLFHPRCCRCGKRLSEQYTQQGYGPECAQYIKENDGTE